MRTKQQQKLLAFRGYDPYDTISSWQQLARSAESSVDYPRLHARRWSESDANRWLRQAS